MLFLIEYSADITNPNSHQSIGKWERFDIVSSESLHLTRHWAELVNPEYVRKTGLTGVKIEVTEVPSRLALYYLQHHQLTSDNGTRFASPLIGREYVLPSR